MPELVIPYAPHPGQWEFHNHPARFRVMACGRRWGKTISAANEAIKFALEHPGAVIWWIAPIYSQAMLCWRLLEEYLPRQVIQDENKSERFKRLINNSEIWIKSGDNPDSLRGSGLDLAIFDEAAFMKEEVWTQAIRPALADKRGRAVMISTPLGRNWFWQCFMRGLDTQEADWKSWQLHTVSNPHIDPAEIEDARRNLPERVFQQEFEAQFLEDAGALFRGVTKCATGELRKGGGIPCVMGVDWGKYNDFTVLTVLRLDPLSVIAWDRFNQIDYAVQRQRLAAMANIFTPMAILAESNSMGEPIIEQLQRDGLPVKGFQTTATSKPVLIETLALAIEKQEIQFPPIPELLHELQAFEMTRKPGGLVKYSAPEGLHDDCVISLALALWAVRSRTTVYQGRYA